MEKYIVILAGPSGVGKTTLSDLMIEREPRYELVRSVTTRAPRGDSHDDEYIYITREEFEARIAADAVLEHTEYGGKLYGTPKSEVDRIFSEGKIPLLILDMNGVRSVKKRNDDFKTYAFYIYDDLNAIEQRLYDRSLAVDPSVENLVTFEKRRRANVADYLVLPTFAPYFDAMISNRGTLGELCGKTFDLISLLHLGRMPEEDPLTVAEDLMLEAKEKNDRDEKKIPNT